MNQEQRIDNKVSIYVSLDIDDEGYCLYEGKVIKIIIIELSVKRFKIKSDTNIHEKITYVCELFKKPINGGLVSIGKEEGAVFKTQEELFESIKIK